MGLASLPLDARLGSFRCKREGPEACHSLRPNRLRDKSTTNQCDLLVIKDYRAPFSSWIFSNVDSVKAFAKPKSNGCLRASCEQCGPPPWDHSDSPWQLPMYQVGLRKLPLSEEGLALAVR